MSQSTIRTVVLIALVPFSIITGLALWFDGVTGIFAGIFNSWGSVQIYVDLLIALTIIMVWLYSDARARGKSPWPWILGTLLVGAFSPLIYLLVRASTKD